MVIMNDLEWPMFSYYVLYYKMFRKIKQQAEKEALIHFKKVHFLKFYHN